MASTNQIFYFPTSIAGNASNVSIDKTTGCNKRDIAAIGNTPAEYHLVFPQDGSPAVVVRFATSTARDIAYAGFMKDYGNSIVGS